LKDNWRLSPFSLIPNYKTTKKIVGLSPILAFTKSAINLRCFSVFLVICFLVIKGQTLICFRFLSQHWDWWELQLSLDLIENENLSWRYIHTPLKFSLFFSVLSRVLENLRGKNQYDLQNTSSICQSKSIKKRREQFRETSHNI
jgi:hypothetical protein